MMSNMSKNRKLSIQTPKNDENIAEASGDTLDEWLHTTVIQGIQSDVDLYFRSKTIQANDKILVIADGRKQENMLAENRKDTLSQTLYQYYNDTSMIARFEDDNIRYDRNTYPYASLPQTRGIGDIEIRANF
jgi:hypothetical protein